MITKRNTVEEARAFLEREALSGTTCPCCSQTVKIYKRALLRSYALWLLWVIKEFQGCPSSSDGWIDVRDTPKYLGRNGDYAKLTWWGLVESAGKRTRMWRPTQEGIQFVQGRLRVPKHAFVFNGILRGFDGAETTDIGEALKEPFVYAEVFDSADGFDSRLPSTPVPFSHPQTQPQTQEPSSG